MDVIQDAWKSTDLPSGTVVTIGNYDGVHRGQRAVIDRVVERSRQLGLVSTLVTFDPHPVRTLRPRESPPALTTMAQKEALLAATGLGAMLVIRFDQEIARIDPLRFATDFLARRLGARRVYVGEDFRFGKERSGDVGLLRTVGEREGFVVDGIAKLQYDGEPISSSRIRGAIADGEVAAAAEMLGRPYELVGSVVRGDRMGQRLGWPTVNMKADNELLPFDGVYATRVRFSGLAAEFDAASNIGTRPTVYENYQRVVESHVLDFDSDAYEMAVCLRFFKRLREERIFPTVMDLSAQIGRDVDSTREYFSRQRRGAT